MSTAPAAADAPPAPLRVDPTFGEEFPGASASASECAMNLVRTATLFLSEADRHRRMVTDLSAAACEVLAILEGAGEPLPPHVVAARLLVTSATMTSVLDTLQRRGYIVRAPHPSDRRKLLIAITDAARSVVDAMLPRIHAASHAVFAPLTEQERATLIDLLGRTQTRLLTLQSVPPSPDAPQRVIPKRA
jgi:DNA-binding MarR family transcriptional regulator